MEGLDRRETLERLRTCKRLARLKIKNQARDTENQIEEAFEMLHKFLQRQECARISALKEEERQKIKSIMQRYMTCLFVLLGTEPKLY
ncbi:hypothetical protein DPEC_G00081110 [Dallia pectoralis]|uniref:Uncharacterized protein n=1 Tax=Dallia pectoralis TaxID=75939 RepID=A0ACC2GY68_DALPE|nr:hypothetical protein DPEC_G00081110 [Dallia pectoralis]